MPATLENASVLHLMIELLKEGKAGIIPELSPLEPIDVDVVISTLSQKTGVDHGRAFERWYPWFMEDCKDVAEHDRESLAIIKRLVDAKKKYVRRR